MDSRHWLVLEMIKKFETIGVVVQGPWHNQLTKYIIFYFLERGLEVVYSGWDEDRIKVEASGYYHLSILTKFTKLTGFNNRNLQRFSVARGVDRLLIKDVQHILKWRSDILPININFAKLVERSDYAPHSMVGSRLVFSAFRSLAVKPDYLSTIPDLYMFGKSNLMYLMWHDKNFDYLTNFSNIVLHEREDVSLIDKNFLGYMFNTHAELYLIFKTRFNEMFNVKFDSTVFFSKIFFLEKDYDHKWLWFDRNLKLRRFKMSEFPKSLPATTRPVSTVVPYDIKPWYKINFRDKICIFINYRFFFLKHIIFNLNRK
jgi:hypothetical protein